MVDTVKTLPPKLQPKIKFESPIGSIESDSGNHMVDGITIVVIILILYIGKKVVDKFFRRIK